jgi:hypothetical protein
MNESSPFFLTNFTENTACLPEGRVFTSYSRRARFRRMVAGIPMACFQAKVHEGGKGEKDRFQNRTI